ncbi:hypothetical protein L0Y47_21390 [Ectopseudomonas composti]
MLNGVGGRTIAEAQQRLSYEEFCSWVRYRIKRGSLHPGMRMERAAGTLAALYANLKVKDGDFRAEDFMLHESRPEPTVEEAMAAWG